MSPSSRRAWVEIFDLFAKISLDTSVALLAEGVGRNWVAAAEVAMSYRVALLAEGVGRNTLRGPLYSPMQVALLAEGVGRNCQ